MRNGMQERFLSTVDKIHWTFYVGVWLDPLGKRQLLALLGQDTYDQVESMHLEHLRYVLNFKQGETGTADVVANNDDDAQHGAGGQL